MREATPANPDSYMTDPAPARREKQEIAQARRTDGSERVGRLPLFVRIAREPPALLAEHLLRESGAVETRCGPASP
jgi:hypothetical protein